MKFKSDRQRRAIFANIGGIHPKTDLTLKVIAKTADEPVYRDDYLPLREMSSDILKTEIDSIIESKSPDITISEILEELGRRHLTST